MDCKAEDSLAYYDLGYLQDNNDYVVESTLSSHKFTFNICQAVKTELWNIGDIPQDQVGAFYRGQHGDFAMGRANSTVTVVDGNPVLYMSNGSPCPNSGESKIHASTAIRFICEPSIFGSGQPRLIAQFPQDDEHACAFSFEWRTPYACPSGRKPAGILHLFILFGVFILIAILVYLACITLYNRFFLGLRGWDQFPSVPWLSPLRFFNWLHDKISGRGDGFVGGPGLRSNSYGSNSSSNAGASRWGGNNRSGSNWTWRLWGRRSNTNGYGRIPEEEEGILEEGRSSTDDEDAATPRGLQDMAGFDNAWENARSGGTMSRDGVIRL
ncbi:mannose 6-phosphate receptor domain-containing protein [Serendipita vermifera]|nr:mannose 6-phosphate receptor domain-containing protein [Serendipita vermifera]